MVFSGYDANPTFLGVTIGGTTAPVSASGLIGPGLYQINITVPSAAVAPIRRGPCVGGDAMLTSGDRNRLRQQPRWIAAGKRGLRGNAVIARQGFRVVMTP